jgi:hypothetical protein
LRKTGDEARSRLELRLSLKEVVQPAFVSLLAQKLAALHPLDLRAHRGETILVGVLHLRLPRHERGQEVVAKANSNVRTRQPKARMGTIESTPASTLGRSR